MIVAVNYADWKYRKAQRFNSRTAIRIGGADRVMEYSPGDLDMLFVQENRHIFSQKRGNGYWLWKPYIILDALRKISEGDYLVYLDSGAFYMDRIRILTEQMERDGQFVMSFELPLKERRFTKRDVFICMQCDRQEYAETNQRMATMVLFKKNKQSLEFVEKWMYYGQKDEIITDAPNRYGYRNYKGFVDNRHDQSIFSLLCKKYGVKAYRDPSQMGRFPDIFLSQGLDQSNVSSDYAQIIAEHRCGKVNPRIYWEQVLYAHAPRKVIEIYRTYFGHAILHIDAQKIALFTDNTPIREERYGYGMYKVVNRLIEAMDENVQFVICTDVNYRKENVNNAIHRRLKVINQFHNSRSDFAGDIRFLAEMFPIIRDLKKKGIEYIFAPLGADYRELKRVCLISMVYHMKVSIYVVDDFVEYYNRILNKDCGNKHIEKMITQCIRQVDEVFCISDGMKKRIREFYGCSSHVLPLPYQYMDIGTYARRKMQIMFIGGINRLYRSGLIDIASVIDDINSENNWDIVLRFTYKKTSEVKRMIGDFACIQTARMETERELRAEMRSSLFCFMPYSDEDGMRVMQETSFPSKLVEYMGAARSIVIYGNRKNSAAFYFDRHELPTVIGEKDKGMLKECILSHVREEMDYSSSYTGILKKYHSYDRVRRSLLKNL